MYRQPLLFQQRKEIEMPTIHVMEMHHSDEHGAAHGGSIHKLDVEYITPGCILTELVKQTRENKFPFDINDIKLRLEHIQDFIDEGKHQSEPDAPFCYSFAELTGDKGLPIEYELAYFV